MRRLIPAVCVAILALGLQSCGGDEPAGDTRATTRSLLSQPRPEDLATTFDAERLGAAEPALAIDLMGINAGSPDAPVKVIEFVDYGCGYCRQFQLETFPALRQEFIETDRIEWKFLPFITGLFPNSAAVTEAAECALQQGPRLFAALDNRLWSEQREWKGSSDAAGLVRGWVIEIGGDAAAYDTCLREGTRHDRVTSATALAHQLGVRATPTFWIVGAGPIQGALPLESFRQVFLQIYEQAADTTNAAG
jgi:protein-disulfide isomerase